MVSTLKVQDWAVFLCRKATEASSVLACLFQSSYLQILAWLMAMQRAGICFGEKNSSGLPKVTQKISSRGSDETEVQISSFMTRSSRPHFEAAFVQPG